MIVNLAPEEKYYFDTYTTLLFARKTKKIVNVISTNEIKGKKIGRFEFIFQLSYYYKQILKPIYVHEAHFHMKKLR